MNLFPFLQSLADFQPESESSSDELLYTQESETETGDDDREPDAVVELAEKLSSEKLSSEKLSSDGLSSEKLSLKKLSLEELSNRMEVTETLSSEQLSQRMEVGEKLIPEKTQEAKLTEELLKLKIASAVKEALVAKGIYQIEIEGLDIIKNEDSEESKMVEDHFAMEVNSDQVT